jgi:hypothetical protein
MRISKDEIYNQFDFLDVIFKKTDAKIRRLNLRDQNFYHHYIKNKDDFVGYGVKIDNMRKNLIFRAPYVINNMTDCNY